MEKQKSRSNSNRGYSPGFGSYYSRYYANTSEAYDLSALEEESPPRRRPKPKSGDNRHKALKKKVKERNKSKYEIAEEKAPGISVASVFTVLTIGAFVFLWLASWSYSAVKQNELAKLTTDYQKLSDENEERLRSIDSRVDLAEIEKIAVNKLGMRHPEDYQKVYIDVPNESYIISYGIEETPSPEFSFSLASIIELFIK